MKRTAKVTDGTALVGEVLRWTYDPDDVGWLVTEFSGHPVYMRINDFPDESFYSVWLGDGWLDFDDLPSTWSVEWPADGWPAGARRALPRGQFHDD